MEHAIVEKSSRTGPMDVFQTCLAVLGLEKAARDSEAALASGSSSLGAVSSYNARMLVLVAELTSSFENSALPEKHRVFPFVLSSVNKIISRLISASKSLPSADIRSGSSLILAVITCFRSSLRGLTSTDLCPSAVALRAGSHENGGQLNTETRTPSVDTATEHDDSSSNMQTKEYAEDSEENSASLGLTEESPRLLFCGRDESSDITEGIKLFIANQVVISKIIFSLTVCIEAIKEREIQNTNKSQTRTVTTIKNISNNNKNNNSSNGRINENEKNSVDNSSDNKNNYPMKKVLNADDDHIIVQCFSALQLAQTFWSLYDAQEKIKIENTVNTDEDINVSNFLRPFSGVYLAQFIQFSLFFSLQR